MPHGITYLGAPRCEQSKLAAKRGVAQPARAAMATNARNIAQQLVTVQVCARPAAS
jgi:hypothetical protein